MWIVLEEKHVLNWDYLYKLNYYYKISAQKRILKKSESQSYFKIAIICIFYDSYYWSIIIFYF